MHEYNNFTIYLSYIPNNIWDVYFHFSICLSIQKIEQHKNIGMKRQKKNISKKPYNNKIKINRIYMGKKKINQIFTIKKWIWDISH